MTKPGTSFCAGIGGGSPAWIDAEEYLVQFSDGHLTEDFTTALGAAMTRRPAQMLARLAAKKFGPNGLVICGDTGDPETLEKDLAILKERRRRSVPFCARICARYAVTVSVKSTTAFATRSATSALLIDSRFQMQAAAACLLNETAFSLVESE
jgi:hypothetical protein